MNNMSTQELRDVVEKAFKRVDKEIMPSNELKKLLNFTGDGKTWGSFIFKLSNYKIVAKVSNKEPVKIGSNKYFYYRLIENKMPAETIEKTEPKFLIFNETTNKYEKAIGKNELESKISILLENEEQTVEIYQLTSIGRKTINITKIA
jgi:hypothetical protein